MNSAAILISSGPHSLIELFCVLVGSSKCYPWYTHMNTCKMLTDEEQDGELDFREMGKLLKRN